MGDFKEYDQYDGLGLAGLVKKKKFQRLKYAKKPLGGSNASTPL